MTRGAIRSFIFFAILRSPVRSEGGPVLAKLRARINLHLANLSSITHAWDMSGQRRVQRWVQAGVIDAETAQRIEDYESSRNSFSVGTWILGLGLVAIGIGVIALVASNWDGISAGLKLACDFGILAVLAWAVLATRGQARRVLQHELSIGLLFFFTLASMALVGQVYQIQAPMARTLLTWFAATTPLLLLSKSGFLAVLWGLLGAVAYLFQLEEIERLCVRFGVGTSMLPAYVWCGPLLFRWVGSSAWFKEKAGKHALALRRISDLASVVGAAMCTGSWYIGHQVRSEWGMGLLFITFALGASIALRKTLWPELKSRTLKFVLGLWVLAWLSLALGILIPRSSGLPVMAAGFQLAMLALMIVMSIERGKIGQFRFWVGAACLRILVVYFELFGSLLDTGLALVGGGVLIVVLAGLWRKWAGHWENQHAKT